MNETTTCAVLTPRGRAAIAIVEVRGPHRTAIVDRAFAASNGRALDDQPADAIRYGRWRTTGEELVVVRRASSIEVHCHGGAAAVGAIMASLAAAGCQRVDAWRHAAPLEDDPIAVAARRALASATTERVAALLVDQWQGALRHDLQEIIGALDAGDLQRADALLAKLARREPLGRHLTQPWRVVLAGAANVGKSSLINALVGFRRAVVFNQPGTTRDIVTANTAVEGFPIVLCDTAGLRPPADDLEAAGIDLTSEALAAADLVVLVDEARTVFESPATATDRLRAWSSMCRPGAPIVAAISKCDLVAHAAADDAATAVESATPWPCVLTSAAEGHGIGELLWRIGNELVPSLPPAGSGIPFAEQHFQAVGAGARYLQAGDATSARDALAGLLQFKPPADLADYNDSSD